jgi:RNA polymerase sigma-70 factor (ECF subfamily)
MLRARTARREQPLDAGVPEPPARGDPASEAALASSVGLALLVVLDTLNPAKRIAFVLHDLFGVAFEEIAAIVGRSPAAARQLASRARRRVQGAPTADAAELARQRALVDRFLVALRAGDVEGLIAVLDPDVVVAGGGGGGEIRGARTWASVAHNYARGAAAVQPALLDGALGLVIAPHGKLARVLQIEFAGDRIVRIDVLSDPELLAGIEIAVLDR